MNIFAIMSFSDEFQAIYEDIIERACKDRRLPIKRADQILEPGNIPRQILERIQDAYFVITEVSEDNPNVFYELGYAHSLNKPIIAIANRARKLPFDISGERTIFYDPNESGWENKLRNDLGDMIDHLFDVSSRLQIDRIDSGDEMEGHYHEITGRLVGLEGGQHLWLFLRRDDLGLWAPQNDGEIEVERDGRWRASMYLGWPHEHEAIKQWFDLLFGTICTTDNRQHTERCIINRLQGDFPPLRKLPDSFIELFRLRVRRLC